MLVFHYLLDCGSYARLLVWSDRPPVAYKPLTRTQVELDSLDRWAVQIAPPPSTLGPLRIDPGPELVECWIPEEEWRNWKAACHGNCGPMFARVRIEKRILELEADPEFPSLLIDPEIISAGARPQRSVEQPQ